jgi:uncharacterized repeat protein (TIGR04076 family)
MKIEKNVKVTVVSSKCHHYKPGDTVYFNGPLVDKEKSDNVCFTALSAIYPFIYSVRKGLGADELGFDELVFQCPDCPEVVEFLIETTDEA